MNNIFYVICTTPKGELSSARTDVLLEDGFQIAESPDCDACGIAVGPMKWMPPYRVKLETWGTEFGDFAFFMDIFLISERFLRVCRKERLVGLSGFEPVTVTGVRRFRKLVGDPPRYFNAEVARSQTALDLERSGLEWEVPGPVCPKCLRPKPPNALRRWKATIIREESWTGEDVFIPRGLQEFVVSQRFVSVCRNEGIKNAVFIRADEAGGDFWPGS